MRNKMITFILPSLIGAAAFLVPFQIHGVPNTLVGHVKEFLLSHYIFYIPLAVTISTLVGLALTLWAELCKPRCVVGDPFWHEQLIVGPFWLASRAVGAAFAVCIFWRLGPQALSRMDIGGTLIYLIAPRILVLAVILSLATPLLLDFGLVEFVAAFARPIMKPLFRLPGRAAVDCLASWIGSGGIAVLITVRMHDYGHYSDREAAVMATTFSVISVPYVYVVADMVDLGHMFWQLLGVIYFTLFILAVVTARIWPLANIPDDYSGGHGKHPFPLQIPEDMTLFRWSLVTALNKSESMTAGRYFTSALHTAVPLVFCTIPLVVTGGTLLLWLSEATPIVDWLTVPFARVLEAASVPEAERVATATVLAYIDQFLGFIVGAECVSEEAKFLCVCISATTLITITETGAHIWHSRIPVGIAKLTYLYIVRAVLSFVILLPITQLIF